MSVISLWLSATAPGVWTLPATLYGFVSTQAPADDFGNPVGDPTSTTGGNIAAGTLDIGGAADFDMLNTFTITDAWFGGTHLRRDAGLVTVQSYVNGYGYETGAAPATYQTITQNGAWNLIKDIAISDLSTDAVTIGNFVDVALASGDSAAHTIDIESAKRGTVDAAGSTNLTIRFVSNEYTWNNNFDVTLGNGTNAVEFEPQTSGAAAALATLEPMVFNTAPQNSRLSLYVGNGNNTIGTEEGSAAIHLGNGTDTVSLIDGHNEVWFGNGGDSVTVQSEPRIPSAVPFETDIGTDVLHLGSGQSSIFLSDANLVTMAQTTIVVPKVLGTTALATSTLVQYGHTDDPSGDFIAGDWSHVTFDFTGFAPGSHAALFQQPGDSTLTVTDSVDHVVRELGLSGGPSLAELHIRFN